MKRRSMCFQYAEGGAVILYRKNRDILVELNRTFKQRGAVTKAQLEFARTEMQALEELYPIERVSDEIRRPHYRTLESYLSFNAMSIKGG